MVSLPHVIKLVYMYVYTYIKYIYTYICVYVYAYIYTYIYIDVCVHINHCSMYINSCSIYIYTVYLDMLPQVFINHKHVQASCTKMNTVNSNTACILLEICPTDNGHR